MKKILYISILLLTCNGAFAQRRNIADANYRRSSIYSILIGHKEEKFADEIKRVFLQMPVSDKYNDHELSVKTTTASSSAVTSYEEAEAFLVSNNVASRLVAKWYNRNILTGECDVELIKQRGIYNASNADREIADRSQRGIALLEDAGGELISNTFVLMNDIQYANKENTGKALGAGLRILGALAEAYTGVQLTKTTDQLASMVETIKGFKTKIRTHLFQLEWNEEYATRFYTDWYSSVPDNEKRDLFEQNRGYFKLKYIGSQSSNASDISIMGVNLDTPDAMVRKACQRALDENIVSLQQNFEAFRIKVPLLDVEPIIADIGLKEGVSANSKFEVLETREDENGKQTYRRVGVIVPVADKIWDNRYMAQEEGAKNATLKYTTFKKVSGGRFYPNMLIREIR